MEQWSKVDKQIIDAHINDFYSATYDSYIQKVGGFDKYVLSLGGVFTECHNKTDLVKTVSAFRKRTNYVQGLMAIWKFCYWNGKTWWFYFNKAAKSFYRTKQTKSCPSGTIVQLCTGAGNRTRITNCNYGVDTLSKALGKPIWSRGYTSMVKNGATVVRDKSKLKVGDLVHFFTKAVTTSNTEKWDSLGWHHVAIVYEITDTDIWLADFGSRFIKTGNPLHRMSKTGTAPGGEYSNYGGCAGIHFLDLVDDTKENPRMYGIDISNHQGKAGMDLAKVLQETKTDFVIVKVTEGTNFVDSYCDGFFQTAKKADKCLGFYHFARPENNSAKAEAEFFWNNSKNYFGQGIPILDWESKDIWNVKWAKEWLDRIYELSGVRPMIYMSELNGCNAYDWSSVANSNYGLWVAKYKDYGIDYNYDMSSAGPAPVVKWWQGYAMWQWTSVGRLNGYSGNLDCNIFYGDKTAWEKYVKGNNKSVEEEVEMPNTVTKGATGTDVYVIQSVCRIYYVKVNGKQTKRTLKLDGKFGDKTLTAVIYWQSKHGLKTDGVVGPKTWKAMWESL